eukprot:3475825-Rhodomonas_salina.1
MDINFPRVESPHHAVLFNRWFARHCSDIASEPLSWQEIWGIILAGVPAPTVPKYTWSWCEWGPKGRYAKAAVVRKGVGGKGGRGRQEEAKEMMGSQGRRRVDLDGSGTRSARIYIALTAQYCVHCQDWENENSHRCKDGKLEEDYYGISYFPYPLSPSAQPLSRRPQCCHGNVLATDTRSRSHVSDTRPGGEVPDCAHETWNQRQKVNNGDLPLGMVDQLSGKAFGGENISVAIMQVHETRTRAHSDTIRRLQVESPSSADARACSYMMYTPLKAAYHTYGHKRSQVVTQHTWAHAIRITLHIVMWADWRYPQGGWRLSCPSAQRIPLAPRPPPLRLRTALAWASALRAWRLSDSCASTPPHAPVIQMGSVTPGA